MNRFGIVPENVTIYPGDVINLNFTAGISPALFVALTNATVTSSFVLDATTNANFLGAIAQRLLSHIGSITITLDANLIPDTGGKIKFSLLPQSVSGGIIIEIHPTTIDVQNGAGTTIDTVSHTAAGGDKFKLEISGSSNRFYLNEILKTTYNNVVASTYPATANIVVYTPMTSATPEVQPPVLIGNWGISKDPIFIDLDNTWTTTGGTLSDASAVVTNTFTAPTAPGNYTITHAIEAQTSQTSTATVTVAPLDIYENTIVELGQGATYRFKTNYDNAQTAGLVTWSVVTGGGGSFDASNLYTAPTAPGDYTIRATSGLQQIDLIVRVSNEITPAYEVVKTAEQVDWDSNMTGTLTWSASAGSINSTTGVWTAPSIDGQVVTISVTNGTDIETRTVIVLTPFAYKPSLTQEIRYTRRVLQSISEDGRVTGRVKNANDASPLLTDLEFRNRDLSEFEAVLTFWRAKYPHRPFCWTDEIRGVRHAVYFDSDLNCNALTDGCIDYSFRIRERA